MEFMFSFTVKDSFILTVYANKRVHRWECGGAFASDWAEKQWYEGVLVISKGSAKWYFFFESYQVRDVPIDPLTPQLLFQEMSNREILDTCEKLAQSFEKSPFPFVKIERDFSKSLAKVRVSKE